VEVRLERDVIRESKDGRWSLALVSVGNEDRESGFGTIFDWCDRCTEYCELADDPATWSAQVWFEEPSSDEGRELWMEEIGANSSPIEVLRPFHESSSPESLTSTIFSSGRSSSESLSDIKTVSGYAFGLVSPV